MKALYLLQLTPLSAVLILTAVLLSPLGANAQVGRLSNQSSIPGQPIPLGCHYPPGIDIHENYLWDYSDWTHLHVSTHPEDDIGYMTYWNNFWGNSCPTLALRIGCDECSVHVSIQVKLSDGYWSSWWGELISHTGASGVYRFTFDALPDWVATANEELQVHVNLVSGVSADVSVE